MTDESLGASGCMSTLPEEEVYQTATRGRRRASRRRPARATKAPLTASLSERSELQQTAGSVYQQQTNRYEKNKNKKRSILRF